MAERPPRPRFAETTTDSPSSLAIILSKNRDITGLKLSDGPAGSALPYAKKLLAEDATPAQKKQLKKAWEWRDGEYAKWHRACAEFDAMQRNAESDEEEYAENSAGERKRKRQKKKDKNESEADEKAKELRKMFEEIQRAYEGDRPEAIRRFAEKLEELSNKPASDAMARYGMCECSASHAVVKSLVLGVAVAAESYWRAHPVSAPREPLDVPKLLREVLARVPDLSGADSVSSILLRLDDVEVAPPRRRRRRRCGSVTGPSRTGAGTASEQWAMLASEACSYVEVELPPANEFDEGKVRSYYEGPNFTENTSKGRKDLDKAVTHWTGISGRKVAALSRPEKIESIVEARRKAHQAPIDQISRAAEPLFDSLVKCRTSAAEFCDVQTCVEVIGHGHAYATTSHCGFLDADKVDHYIAKFKAAQKAGSITDAEYFYFDGTDYREREREYVTTGHRLTESLQSEDSPLSMMGAEGRISIIGKGELYATDLSKTKLVLGFVVDGGVRNVDDVETSVDGRLVVALHRRGELYFFLIGRGQFLLANKLTPACAARIMQIAGPLLWLTYQQDTDSVSRLKKEALDDDGLVVGKKQNGSMIGDFKVVLPKMVASGVSKGLIKFE